MNKEFKCIEMPEYLLGIEDNMEDNGGSIELSIWRGDEFVDCVCLSKPDLAELIKSLTEIYEK